MGKKAIVAGHICLDITPEITPRENKKIEDLLSPGKVLHVGAADIHPGGAVANTGLAMKVLGADVSLVARTGDDPFADMVVSFLDKYGVSDGIVRSKGDTTSYSVVVAIPGIDRIFLHNPGANDNFTFSDLPMDKMEEASLFHFGYPPIMKKMYENKGEEFIKIKRSVKEAGLATSVDLAAVDPASESGKTDWAYILERALPYIDIFAPSIEELLFMMDREKYDKMIEDNPGRDLTEVMDLKSDIEPLAGKCLDSGAAIVLLKCGAPGMYFCSAGPDRIGEVSERLGLDPADWGDKAWFEKSFKPKRVLSATGAGDAAIAAFLTAILMGKGPEDCVKYAAMAGASAVTAYDAISGLKSFEEMEKEFLA